MGILTLQLVVFTEPTPPKDILLLVSWILKIFKFGSHKIFSEFVAINKHLVYFDKNPTGGRKTVAGSVFSADKDLETMNEINVLAGNMSMLEKCSALWYQQLLALYNDEIYPCGSKIKVRKLYFTFASPVAWSPS